MSDNIVENNRFALPVFKSNDVNEDKIMSTIQILCSKNHKKPKAFSHKFIYVFFFKYFNLTLWLRE